MKKNKKDRPERLIINVRQPIRNQRTPKSLRRMKELIKVKRRQSDKTTLRSGQQNSFKGRLSPDGKANDQKKKAERRKPETKWAEIHEAQPNSRRRQVQTDYNKPTKPKRKAKMVGLT